MTKVMIVEDDPFIRETTVEELRYRGYEIVDAKNGRGALDLLRAEDAPPDLIVSDISMPDMDGYELLRHVRENPDWNALPFLFATANTSRESVLHGKELGADDYITKPFLIDDLVVAIENKLKRVQEFRRAAERNLDDARRNLLRMLSHELRTPLTAVSGGSEMLEDLLTDVPDETVHTMVFVIRQGADRLTRFTAQALALLQIDSGDLQRAFRKSRHMVDVNMLVDAAVRVMRSAPELVERRVTITRNRLAEPLFVEGVEEFLNIMVEEPLRNAVTFSPKAGTVDITVSSDDEYVIITTRDRGPGIPQAEIPRVWERFSQIDRGKFEQQGAGLGLALVRESARIHGGDCRIVCPPEGGTIFTLKLPIARPQ